MDARGFTLDRPPSPARLPYPLDKHRKFTLEATLAEKSANVLSSSTQKRRRTIEGLDEAAAEQVESEGGCEDTEDLEAVVGLEKGLLQGLPQLLDILKKHSVDVNHAETREGMDKKTEIFLRISGKTEDLDSAEESLNASPVFDLKAWDLRFVEEIPRELPWFPLQIEELDDCRHLITKFQPEMDEGHPGFVDPNYRDRRNDIANIAFGFKSGDKIPRVEYTPEEHSTWGVVYRKIQQLLPTHACSQHIRSLGKMERECGYGPDQIPQMEDVSHYLRRETGFQLRPVAGLVSSRDFLASLAFRVFQCTQYVRHPTAPMHSPEPDCIHELIGHVPLLADPTFAVFSQEIGLASLGASEEDIVRLATMYWFTIEFGLCKEANGDVRAFGAGLLSSFGELQHALDTSKCQHKTFDPTVTAVEPYDDQSYQPVYFVAESFDDATEKLRNFARTLDKPFEVAYNPYTMKIEFLDSSNKIQQMVSDLKNDMERLNLALSKIGGKGEKDHKAGLGIMNRHKNAYGKKPE